MHALDLNLTVLSQQQTGKLFSPPFQFSSIHIFILKKKYIYIYKIKLQNTTKILLRI